MTDSYVTIQSASSDQIVIQKSRFIGYAAPCNTEEEALAFIRKIREEHREAKHHCYAYIIGLNCGIMRYSDDGEPGGTAGLPMMSILKNEGIVNCCIVVVRYFGGILLGTGGLVRAYSQGCKIALQAAGVVRMELSVPIRCRVPYSAWNTVQYGIGKMPVQLEQTNYLDNVEFVLISRKNDVNEVIRQIGNMTDGKAQCSELKEAYRAWTVS